MFRPRRHDRSRIVRLIGVAAVLALAMSTQACLPASANTRVGSTFFGLFVPGLEASFPASLDHQVGAVNLTLNGVYWPSLETSPDVWDWTRLDALVAQAQAHDARPLLVLGQTPSWAAKHPNSVPPMGAWTDYVHEVAARYKTKLDYEIWPEANIVSHWTGTPKQLASRVIAAAQIIHRVAKSAVVVSPAMVLRLRYQRGFMDKFFAAKVDGQRVGRFVDAVGLDPYPLEKGSPEDSMVLVRQARAILRSHKVTAPVWNVEVNYGVVAGGQTPHHPMSATKQASYVVRTYVLSAAADVKRVYWLLWGGYTTLAITLASSDGSPTMAGTAYGVVASWLTGQTSRGCALKKKAHLYTCRFVRSGHSSWVYWTTKGKASVRAPRGSRHVETMTGAVRRTHAGKRLTVTTSPVRVYH